MDNYVIVTNPNNGIVLGVNENHQVPETIIEIHIEERNNGINHQKVMCAIASFLIVMIGGSLFV